MYMVLFNYLKKIINFIAKRITCKKFYKIAIKLKDDIDNRVPSSALKKSNKVFVCWLQGMENAPDIVQLCYESLLKFNSDKEIVVITEDNLNDYVKFPQYILDKYKKGYITKTHFSDLLRLELLIKYGGTWVDSTVFFTDKIPDFIIDSDIFVFQNFEEHKGTCMGISNWFISACADNKLLILERELLYKYWAKNKKLKDYFLFHSFFCAIVIKLYREEWSKVVISDNLSPKILDCYLFRQFDAELYSIIEKKSFAHKFMYKYPQKDFEKSGTFYKFLLEGRKEQKN